ncbi:MAG: hypothetical protein ACOCY0_04650 [Roseicyclus sp.]
MPHDFGASLARAAEQAAAEAFDIAVAEYGEQLGDTLDRLTRPFAMFHERDRRRIRGAIVCGMAAVLLEELERLSPGACRAFAADYLGHGAAKPGRREGAA